MTQTTINSLSVTGENEDRQETLRQGFVDWMRTELVWYAGSFSLHLLGLSILLLLPNVGNGPVQDDSPTLVSRANESQSKDPEKLERIDLGRIDDIQPPDLSVIPTSLPPALVAEPVMYHGNGLTDVPEGGGTPNGIPSEGSYHGTFDIGPATKIVGTGGLEDGLGIGAQPGNDGNANDFKRRGHFHPGPDNIPRNYPAVTAALVWLANHQLYDGRWSLQHFQDRCTDKTCTGAGEVLADAGATAMGLLPFLAAGQTHKSKGPYREYVRKGIQWLIHQQQPDGNLAKGAVQMMYSHGLATIALCEAYGLTGDKEVGRAAQGAVNFILAAQNKADGGWRYNPGDPGDTSVVGWQLMALKSARMAGLDIGGSAGGGAAFAGVSKWLDSVAAHDGSQYSYQPGQAPSDTMTAVGLLCRQYLGARRDDPMLSGGMSYLMNNLPADDRANIYYYYYATQVMHNMYGSEWDTWNRKMRSLLLRTQVRNADECANGSWAPQNDAWGKRGGRLMTTSLACLTLEVYYRYLPLFKAETGSQAR